MGRGGDFYADGISIDIGPRFRRAAVAQRWVFSTDTIDSGRLRRLGRLRRKSSTTLAAAYLLQDPPYLVARSYPGSLGGSMAFFAVDEASLFTVIADYQGRYMALIMPRLQAIASKYS